MTRTFKQCSLESLIAIDAILKLPIWHLIHRRRRRECATGWTKRMTMSDILLAKLPGRVRGRSFEKGRSGNPAGRRTGSRNKATLAAALLAGESEALTRKAIELALAGDPTAIRLCIEWLLQPCRERTVKFTLPPIDSVSDIGRRYNVYERFCCTFAAGAAIGNNRQFVIVVDGDRATGSGPRFRGCEKRA
jgi:hypothetical protein